MTITDEAVEEAANSLWINLAGDVRQTPIDVITYQDAARAALEAAEKHRAGGVRVKRLEWCADIVDPELRGGRTAYALSILGAYKVWGDGSWITDPPGGRSTGGAGSIDDGKRAAQADYERRILSALTETTEDTALGLATELQLSQAADPLADPRVVAVEHAGTEVCEAAWAVAKTPSLGAAHIRLGNAAASLAKALSALRVLPSQKGGE